MGFMNAEPPAAATITATGPPSQCSADRIEAFQKLEDQRREFFRDLLENNDSLKNENEALRQEIESLKLAASQSRDDGLEQCQMQLQNTELQLRAAQRSMEKSPFVLVLVDGNAHAFHNSLFRQGADGGADAAIKLQETIEQQPICASNPDWKIVLRIYLDFQGLVEDSGRLLEPISETRLRKFVGGFTQVQPLYDIIDTGPGTEEALVKIQECSAIFIDNVQCKHIFYGCAFNDSSLATLEAYKYDPIMASSFTLIKSRAPEDLNIHIAFELVEFPAVFRSSSGAEDTTAGVGASVNGVNSRASATNRRTWFVPDRSRIPPSRNKIRKTQYNGSSRSSWDNAERIVLLNINNERVDPPAPNFNSIRFGKFMSRYEKKKLCHFHYLLGICNSLNCPYTHHVELNPEELNMFRYCTRRLRCSSGLSCRELRCIYGHICPYETAGFCKKGRECAFRSVHNVNRTAVKVWDGYDEPPSSTDGTPQNQFSETGGDEEEHEHEPGVYESAAEGMDIEDDSQGQAGPTLWATPWPRRSPFPWERKNGSTDSDQTKQSVPEARSTPPSAPEEDIPDIAQEEEKAKMAYIQYFTKK